MATWQAGFLALLATLLGLLGLVFGPITQTALGGPLFGGAVVLFIGATFAVFAAPRGQAAVGYIFACFIACLGAMALLFAFIPSAEFAGLPETYRTAITLLGAA